MTATETAVVPPEADKPETPPASAEPAPEAPAPVPAPSVEPAAIVPPQADNPPPAVASLLQVLPCSRPHFPATLDEIDAFVDCCPKAELSYLHRAAKLIAERVNFRWQIGE